MSGGRFNYMESTLKGEIFGWSDKPRNVFEDREISELVWDVLDLIHDYDWYDSGDTCEETYLKAKAAFKAKWFGDRDARIKQIIDQAFSDAKEELYKTFDVKEEARTMTTLEYMTREMERHAAKYKRQKERGASEQELRNIQEKVRHYEFAVIALRLAEEKEAGVE